MKKPTDATPPERKLPEDMTLGELVTLLEKEHANVIVPSILRLRELADRILKEHGCRYEGVLSALANELKSLERELHEHICKEEHELFPAALGLRETEEKGSRKSPVQFSVIPELQHEHENATDVFVRIRHLTGNYRLPEEGECLSGLYDGVRSLETTLLYHIGVEEKVLLPRAMKVAVGKGKL